jgi:hypothetical protein
MWTPRHASRDVSVGMPSVVENLRSSWQNPTNHGVQRPPTEAELLPARNSCGLEPERLQIHWTPGLKHLPILPSSLLRGTAIVPCSRLVLDPRRWIDRYNFVIDAHSEDQGEARYGSH